MANVFTGLIQTAYTAMQVVSRERVGMYGAVSKNAMAERVGLNQPITSPIIDSKTVTDIAPANVRPEGASTTARTVSLTIDNQKKADFHLTGEEYKALAAGNVDNPVTVAQIAQCMRAICNAIEDDLAGQYVYASRAYGTAGTTPFATGDDLTDLTQVMKILDDNGAPMDSRSLILNTTANAQLLGKQPAMFRINEAGEDLMRRQAMFRMQFGAYIGVSNGLINRHTVGGDLTGVMINQSTAPAGYFPGDIDLTVDGAGAGETRNVGDFITIAGDANKYMVRTAAAASFTELQIQRPGLRAAAADNAAITGGGAYTPNLALSMDAIHLALRLPALPPEGDMGIHFPIMDQHSGMMFELSHYPQYRQSTYEVSAAWGVVSPNPQHMAVLLG